MERRKFTREFKLEAVRLIKNRGVSYVQASQDLSVHTSQLRDWVKRVCRLARASAETELYRWQSAPRWN
jgi:transposase-like protein